MVDSDIRLETLSREGTTSSYCWRRQSKCQPHIKPSNIAGRDSDPLQWELQINDKVFVCVFVYEVWCFLGLATAKPGLDRRGLGCQDPHAWCHWFRYSNNMQLPSRQEASASTRPPYQNYTRVGHTSTFEFSCRLNFLLCKSVVWGDYSEVILWEFGTWELIDRLRVQYLSYDTDGILQISHTY